jgi:hypothetical protein
MSASYCMHLLGVNEVEDEKHRSESLVARCNSVALDHTDMKRSFFFFFQKLTVPLSVTRFPHFMLPQLHCRRHKSLHQVPILSQMHAGNILVFSFYKSGFRHVRKTVDKTTISFVLSCVRPPVLMKRHDYQYTEVTMYAGKGIKTSRP